jgi:hypothetical protein
MGFFKAALTEIYGFFLFRRAAGADPKGPFRTLDLGIVGEAE